MSGSKPCWRKIKNCGNGLRFLRSIPEFGPVLTANLIGQVPELGTLHEKQVAALVGLAPINCESGKYMGIGASKAGAAVYADFYTKQHFGPLALTLSYATSQKGCAKGKPHKVVLIAVARKMIVLANSLLAKNAMRKPITQYNRKAHLRFESSHLHPATKRQDGPTVCRRIPKL